MTSGIQLISIKKVQSKSSLKKFDCGNDALNTFLSGYALKNDALGLGKTFLAVDEKGTIAGYFTLATSYQLKPYDKQWNPVPIP